MHFGFNDFCLVFLPSVAQVVTWLLIFPQTNARNPHMCNENAILTLHLDLPHILSNGVLALVVILTTLAGQTLLEDLFS